MPAWLDSILVTATVSVALGYLLRGWIRRARNKGAACASGCCCPAAQRPDAKLTARRNNSETFPGTT